MPSTPTSASEAVQPAPKTALLRVEELRTYFFTSGGTVRAADGVSFDVFPGEVFGLVGESGSGKTVTALSIMRLVPPPGRIVGGKVSLNGKDLLALSEEQMRQVRGREISMIFQDPLSSLNPVFKVGDQIAETLMIQGGLERRKAWDRSVRMLELVGIPDASARAEQYSFQLSGGMRQRVMIAMALAVNPPLLIADEPTTNLDVTIQAQILSLLKAARDTEGISVVLITHNLGIVAWICDRMAVMYAGEIVEQGPVEDLFANPQHPYTEALLQTMPRLDHPMRLHAIEGEVPNLASLPSGCRFHPRCKYAKEVCRVDHPALLDTKAGWSARCLMRESDSW